MTQGPMEHALGLPIGWHYDQIQNFEGAVVITARVDFRPDAPCRCEGLPTWHRAGTYQRSYRSLPLGGRPTLILLRYPRYRCAVCKHQAGPPLPRGSVTEEFGELLGEHALRHPISETCRTFVVGREVVRARFDTVVERRLADREVLPPNVLGIDDTMFAGRRRVALVDVERGLHIDILEGYSTNEIAQALANFRPTWDEHLRCVIIDPYKPFRLAVMRAWPHLPVVLDRYHVAALINRSVSRFAEAYHRSHPGMGATRWLRHPQRLGYGKKREMLVQDHPDLLAAYEYAQKWQSIYETASSAEARYLWQTWRSQMPEDLRDHLAVTVDDLTEHWLEEICAAVDLRSALGYLPTNGTTESLHKRVRVWEARVGGLTFEALRARVLLTTSSKAQDDELRQRLQGLAVLEARLKVDK